MIERMCLSDFLGDFVIYRKLEPSDARLRGLSIIHGELGLPADRPTPRKTEPAYAAVTMHLLRQAQSLRGAAQPLQRLLYIGDTKLDDGIAAANLGQHLALRGFIGQDRPGEPLKVETRDGMTFANRWTALEEFLRVVQAQGFVLGESLAVILDLDKTAIAARDTVHATLGEGLSMEVFRPIYDELHKPVYHPFTTDNQD